MKRTITMILSLVLVLTMVTGCTVVNVAKAGTVNGEDVPLGAYKYAVRIAEMYFGQMDYEDKLTMVAMYDQFVASMVYTAIADIMAEAGTPVAGENLWEKEYGDTTVGDAVKAAVFDEFAKTYVAAEEATKRGIVLTEEENDAVSELKSSLYKVLASKSSFDETLGKINLTGTQLFSLWEKIILASKLSNALAEESEVTDEMTETYFNDNYMRVKHILVKTGDEGIETMEQAKAKADEIIAELNAGGDFEALMTTYSSDVDAEGNINGGDEGYVFKEGDFGNPAFEDASKALEIGSYTAEAVEVKGGSYEGYHIIKRYEIADNYFAENKETLAPVIEAEINNDAYEAYVEGLMAEAEISKSDSKINRVKLTYIEVEAAPEVGVVTE